jgi:RNA polymerase sigma factor (sigma-70 family)
MVANHSSATSVAPLPNELDRQLLRGAQVFLRSRKSRLIPSKEDERSFDRLYDLCDPWLRWLIAARGLKGEDAKDCLQNVWTAITEGLLRFEIEDGQDGLRGWMRSLVRNKAADIGRDRTRHPTTPLDAQMAGTLVCRDAGPIAEYEQHCLEEAVRQLLKRLRTRVRKLTYRVFHKHWVEGKTVGQIASEMRLLPHWVSCRLCRANEKLRKLAEQEFPNMNEHMNSGGGGNGLRGSSLRGLPESALSASPEHSCRVLRSGLVCKGRCLHTFLLPLPAAFTTDITALPIGTYLDAFNFYAKIGEIFWRLERLL